MDHHHGHHHRGPRGHGHNHGNHFDPSTHHGLGCFAFAHHCGPSEAEHVHGPSQHFEEMGHFGHHRHGHHHKHGHHPGKFAVEGRHLPGHFGRFEHPHEKRCHRKFGKHGKHNMLFGMHGRRHGQGFGHHRGSKHHGHCEWVHHGGPQRSNFSCCDKDGVSELSKMELKAKKRARWGCCERNEVTENAVNPEEQPATNENQQNIGEVLNNRFGRLRLGRHRRFYGASGGLPQCCRNKDGADEAPKEKELGGRKGHLRCCCCCQKNTDKENEAEGSKATKKNQEPVQIDAEQRESSERQDSVNIETSMEVAEEGKQQGQRGILHTEEEVAGPAASSR